MRRIFHLNAFFAIVFASLLSRISYQMARSPVLPIFAANIGASPEFITSDWDTTKLRSEFEFGDAPGVLIFAEKDGPPFHPYGKDAGKPLK